jgi:hypothetical protein
MINDTLTQEEFIRMVIQWNQASPHQDNVIPDINWSGERNIRYGNDDLWLDIEEYRNENIIAVRFEKRESDGAVWDTDYIMNFSTMKMTVQLDRGYTEDAQMEDLQFSTPHFITMLIDGGFVVADNGLDVLRQATIINQENLSVLTDVINGRSHYRLPVVYVSKTAYNKEPVNMGWLCSKLKGVAHVLLEEDKQLDDQIRLACDDNNEYLGGIGIYFPNGKHRRFLYRSYTGSDNILMDKVARSVFQYMNAQKLPLVATWQGVINSLLTDRYVSQKAEKAEAERAREKAENEVEFYIGAFDEDNENLRKQIEELTRANTSLQMENQGLRAKLSGAEDVPILFLGAEEEFYQGEIKEMILDAVAENLKNVEQKTRRADVLNDILQSNNYQRVGEERERIVKIMFKEYKTLTTSVRQQLQELGFEITEDGKHYRLTYYGDDRYKTTFSKTASDWREGKNMASTIIKNMM